MNITFYPLNPSAIQPQKATNGSIGYDLHSIMDYVILPGQRATIPTGISVELPEGTYGRIAPRSGIAVKHGIQVLAGVIDPDYTGEIRVVLHNTSLYDPYVINKGYRIAQLIFERAVTDANVTWESYVPPPENHHAGFGSTGV
jgi:dUTP pyrophosphatase